MRLRFYGAAHCVTGSCHVLEACGKRILIDCGLQQGRDETDNAAFPFAPQDIDFVVLTHAHIDHSGRLPLLAARGFRGGIFTTRLTARLMEIMLLDSAHIQESDAAWENQKGERAGRGKVEPLYTSQDVEDAMKLVHTADYGTKIKLADGLDIRFADAGHLLGSAFVELWITEAGESRKLVFSGDIGNKNQPVIRDPQYIRQADFVVMESTYGDRDHENEGDYTEALAQVIDTTLARGGNVVIPSFAVGRTQELLYFIREIKERGLVKSVKDFPVVVDSPLANAATQIYAGDLRGYLDEEAIALVQGGRDMFRFPGLQLVQATEESKCLNSDKRPKVIISASGMCDAGRIRHHLKHNLWRPECTVAFVGYQTVGSLGRRLLDGASTVKLFGETIAVKAGIVNFHGLSSHAGRADLLAWAKAYIPAPKSVFVVHGESDVTEKFAAALQAEGIFAYAPLPGDCFDLCSGTQLEKGALPEKKTAVRKDSPLYLRLLTAGKRLLAVIGKNREAANKDLIQFTQQVEKLADKWDRE